MEFVLDWPLYYRTDESMLAIAKHLSPAPEHAGVTRDASGYCLFLDATRPA